MLARHESRSEAEHRTEVDATNRAIGSRDRRLGLTLAACCAAERDGGRRNECSDHDRSESHDDPQPDVTAPSMLARFGNQDLRRKLRWALYVRDHDATITSTMLRVKVDRDEGLALHDQVAAEIRRAIADGEAGPGDRLPPAKDLAAVLEVNTNTVLRALRLLRDEGLLEFRRGRGITVAGTPERSALLSQARDLVEQARRYGYRREDVIDMIASLP